MVIGIIVFFIIAVLLIYGTLSPCGILKKEIAREAGKNGGQGLYVLLGGFIERGINTLNPIQCLGGLYKIKTEGVDATLNNLLK